MQKKYPAHIRIYEDGKRKYQTCKEHSYVTAKYAGEALRDVNLQQSAFTAGLLHDMGKMKSFYREYLEKRIEGEDVRQG